MSEKSRSEWVARSEIKFAFDHFMKVEGLRKEIRILVTQLNQHLNDAADCLQIVKNLRWGKTLVEEELKDKDKEHLANFLRLFDGDRRE